MKVLAREGPSAFADELKRLSGLGSQWASAALGYSHLFPDRQGTRRPDIALQICGTPHHARDPYAQYIAAWALLLSGQHKKALATLRSSAHAGFLPAMLDLGRFVQVGWGVVRPDAKSALALFRLAERAGHKGARGMRYRLYQLGECGTLLRVWGVVMMPIFRLSYIARAAISPFDESVFFVDASEGGSLFR